MCGAIFFKTQHGQLDLTHSLTSQIQIIYLNEDEDEKKTEEAYPPSLLPDSVGMPPVLDSTLL